MKAAVYTTYGPPSVLRIEDRPDPVAADNELLVEVAASAVTAADWRFRASDFPGSLWLAGRLMAGAFKPRRPILGMDFSGRIKAVGKNVRKFHVGQDVFGTTLSLGTHAGLVTVKADGAIVAKPDSLTHEQAVALPFGGLTALVYLRDFTALKQGDAILIAGATGNVGSMAIQIARHLGARVTALASAPRRALALELGAHAVIDYRATPPSAFKGPFDVIFDTAGVLAFSQVNHALSPQGRFAPLEFGALAMIRSLWLKLFSRKRLVIGVSGETAADLEVLAALAATGQLKPVIDSTWKLDDIALAHERAQSRHKAGAVVVQVAGQASHAPQQRGFPATTLQ